MIFLIIFRCVTPKRPASQAVNGDVVSPYEIHGVTVAATPEDETQKTKSRKSKQLVTKEDESVDRKVSSYKDEDENYAYIKIIIY